jgi:DNA polymerase I-like protein with 3'-5' exonuclease and polymerase domains
MDLVGRKPEEDVYEYTSRVVLDRALNRDESKSVVMGVLYGIGTTRLQTILGNKVSAAEVMAEVRSHFGVRVLENKLKRELKEKGYITNHYGRILKPQRNDAAGLVSWHVQSTGVDLGMQGFQKLMSRIEEEGMSVAPLFFIHDALLLDVHPDVTDYDLKVLASEASQPPGFEQEFPLKVTNVDS